ncbi:MAG: flagellar basal body P-ring protein FlgI [Leptospiraceae bacterium]|nr:flagellar basal body P-ring protein FlgI [Leptospiraceae bacterium]
MKVLILLISLFFSSHSVFSVDVKLKDLVRIDGIRENQITGFGIVTGLSGTGDTKNAITTESMQNYLKNQGLSASSNPALTRNIASVIVTANIPTYAKPGDKIDVTVSSIGDAKSLEGGVLLQSPLKAANNDIIAVAGGVISFGGKDNKTSSNISRTIPKTVGVIQGGGIVEKELANAFLNQENKYRLILQNQDFATLDLIQKAIADTFGSESITSRVVSPVEIELSIPEKTDAIGVLGRLENLTITPENKARIVVNERTGTIVMGGNVTIDEVAISKQGLSVIVSGGQKKRFWDDPEKVENVLVMQEATKVSDLVKALNKIGASTRDVIAILEALRKSGAMHAEVIVQ